jgi:DNA-binding transcriptional LysR family regulator
MMPSSADLSYFIEVVSALNLSRAAERLGMSQPSLTLAIQRLEQSIGTPLLVRSKKGVTLTQAGKQLAVRARDLLQQWDTVKNYALASTHEIQGNYTVGCHVSVALYSLAHALADLLEEHPHLEVKLAHDLSRKITERVIRMEIEVGIVVNPVKHPDLVIRKLCSDEVTFWVGKGNRKIQNFREGNAVLICDPDLLQTQDLLKKLKKSGIRYGRILTSSSLEVITELTASGAGIGVIPSRVAAYVAGKGLRRIPKAPSFRDEICLLYRVENRGVKSVQAIADRIALTFQSKLNAEFL